MRRIGAKWTKFWGWYDQFYLSGTPILGPLTGGKWMQMSPKALVANLLGLLGQENGAQEERDEYREGCEIEESHDWFRKPVLPPEEFFNLLNEELVARGFAEGRTPPTWDELYEIMREIERFVEHE